MDPTGMLTTFGLFYAFTGGLLRRADAGQPMKAALAVGFRLPTDSSAVGLGFEPVGFLSVMATRRHRSARPLLLAGCACLALMVLTHIAERCGIVPGMGWGLPNSPGHYLDLISAVSGIGLLVAAGLARFVVRVRGGK